MARISVLALVCALLILAFTAGNATKVDNFYDFDFNFISCLRLKKLQIGHDFEYGHTLLEHTLLSVIITDLKLAYWKP